MIAFGFGSPGHKGSVNPAPFVALMLALVFATGCVAQARDKALSASLVALNAARDGLVAYSKDHEASIVTAATSEADGKIKLASFRVKVDEVVTTLEGAYLAIAAAAVANDAGSLSSALSAVGLVQAAWGKLHGGLL